MQPKLFKTSIAEYEPATWTGKNESGIFPTGDRVLIKPDQASEQSSGGVHIPEEISARHTLAAEAGIVIELGEGAFIWNSDKQTPYHGRKPKSGERVCVEKYAGQLIRGDDGEMYRLMESSCIAAIITPGKKVRKPKLITVDKGKII